MPQITQLRLKKMPYLTEYMTVYSQVRSQLRKAEIIAHPYDKSSLTLFQNPKQHPPICLLPFQLISRVDTETDTSREENICLFESQQILPYMLQWPCTLCSKGVITQTDPSPLKCKQELANSKLSSQPAISTCQSSNRLWEYRICVNTLLIFLPSFSEQTQGGCQIFELCGTADAEAS